ncbi:MAG: hypothetical protein LUD47_01365 [Clostridia bacterium]|nr:hypothetical protein [Clostridia bacterium]
MDTMPLEGADLCDMYGWGDIGACPEPDSLFVILPKKKRGLARIKIPGMRIRKVLIVCEGYDEETRFEQLCGCGVRSADITVETGNVKSGNVKPLKSDDT